MTVCDLAVSLPFLSISTYLSLLLSLSSQTNLDHTHPSQFSIAFPYFLKELPPVFSFQSPSHRLTSLLAWESVLLVIQRTCKFQNNGLAITLLLLILSTTTQLSLLILLTVYQLYPETLLVTATLSTTPLLVLLLHLLQSTLRLDLPQSVILLLPLQQIARTSWTLYRILCLLAPQIRTLATGWAEATPNSPRMPHFSFLLSSDANRSFFSSFFPFLHYVQSCCRSKDNSSSSFTSFPFSRFGCACSKHCRESKVRRSHSQQERFNPCRCHR